jgi:hypothetical protein
MERIYRITLNGGIECSIVAEDAKAAKEKAKAQNNGIPILKTVFDLYSSDLGNEINQKKKELKDKMQKLASEYIQIVREIERDGLEELVEYKFFTNIDYCHVGLNFTSLVDERELRIKADEIYEKIVNSYLTEKEKIHLLVNNVNVIDVITDRENKSGFTLSRKKFSWENIHRNESMLSCVLTGGKKNCEMCENFKSGISNNCYGVASMFLDKDVLALLETNNFEIHPQISGTKDFYIVVYM